MAICKQGHHTRKCEQNGLHLFNIFINDLTIRDNPSTSLVKYADDTTLLCAIKKSGFDYSIDIVEQYMNWSKNNCMPCNVKKCKELIFRKKNCTDDIIPINNIQQVDSLKMLGVTFQSNCRFNEHVKSKLAEANRVWYIY